MKQFDKKEQKVINEFELNLAPQNEKKTKKQHIFLDMMTFQAIWCVIIVIVMVIGHMFLPIKFNSVYITLKKISLNDFSFKNSLYESVGNFITTLNQFTPDSATVNPLYSETNKEKESSLTSNMTELSSDNESLNGVGGEANPVTQMMVPHNSTFAPILNTGTITFPISDEYRITSEFGFRKHPITQKDDFHNALDIAAKEGSLIKAIANGVVVKVGSDSSLGNFIILDHKNGFVSKYGHCSKIIAKEKNVIREGEIIAKVGSSGIATGPHLHLATIKNDLYFNPMKLFKRDLL